MTKPTIPQVFNAFLEYGRRNPCWGNLHVVMDDSNYHPDHILSCWHDAMRERDSAGCWLAEILLSMSWTQRRKLAARANATLGAEWLAKYQGNTTR